MFRNHPNIIRIKEDHMPNCFSFLPISESDIHDLVINLDSSKAYQKYDIPPKILKENEDICKTVLCADINNCIAKGSFPTNLKNADITPTFKKIDRLQEVNYRHVSILLTLSNIYEKIPCQQIYLYFDDIFSKHLCGYRKCHSTQHCLLFMLESLKKALKRIIYWYSINRFI